jgi:hypothetical protein
LEFTYNFPGHGWNDLAVANSWHTASTVTVMLNAGDGTFGARVDYSASHPWHITTGDLNGDGHADITQSEAARAKGCPRTGPPC